MSTTTTTTSNTSALDVHAPRKDAKQNVINFLHARLEERAADGLSPFVLPPAVFASWRQQFDISEEDLLRKLSFAVRHFARCPVSNFQVGAACIGESGTVYMGVNIEHVNVPLSYAVHAEQCMVTNVALHGFESRIRLVATNAVPCGHCRQFLKELHHAEEMDFIVDQSLQRLQLRQLLPIGFGPLDLGNEDNLILAQKRVAVVERGASRALTLQGAANDGGGAPDAALTAAAEEAFCRAYAPYSKASAGVGLRLRAAPRAAVEEEALVALPFADSRYVFAPLLESAAYNPTLSPVQSACAVLFLLNLTWDDVEAVQLCEVASEQVCVQHLESSLVFLRAVAPKIDFWRSTVVRFDEEVNAEMAEDAATRGARRREDGQQLASDNGVQQPPPKRTRRLPIASPKK